MEYHHNDGWEEATFEQSERTMMAWGWKLNRIYALFLWPSENFFMITVVQTLKLTWRQFWFFTYMDQRSCYCNRCKTKRFCRIMTWYFTAVIFLKTWHHRHTDWKQNFKKNCIIVFQDSSCFDKHHIPNRTANDKYRDRTYEKQRDCKNSLSPITDIQVRKMLFLQRYVRAKKAHKKPCSLYSSLVNDGNFDQVTMKKTKLTWKFQLGTWNKWKIYSKQQIYVYICTRRIAKK